MPDLDLTVKPTTPLDTNPIEKMIQLRSLMSQDKLRQAQIQEAGARLQQTRAETENIQSQAQQRERDIADRKTQQKALLDANGDWKLASKNITGIVDPLNQATFDKAHADAMEAVSKQNAEKNKLDQSLFEQVDSSLNGIRDISDDQKHTEYSNWLNRMQGDETYGPVISKGLQAGLIPKQYSKEGVDALHSYVVGHLGILKEAEAQQQTATSAANANRYGAQAKEAEAKTQELNTETAGTQLAAAFRQGGASGMQQVLDSMPHSVAKNFQGANSEADILRRAQKPEQIVQSDQAKANLAETSKYHKGELDIAAQRLGLERKRLMEDEATGKLTPEALDKMAEMFATTGQIPSIGWGKQAAQMRAEVMNKAAEKYPSVQFATQKAAFQANEASLKQLTTQTDQITAYEGTAGKNLQNFIKQAKGVIDTGSPWINEPLRSIAKKGLGSTDVAAYDAALQVARSEIARVLTASPTGGGVVSDTAREEAKKLIGDDATMKQIYRASDIIYTDMENRLQKNKEQIAAITKRISGATDDNKPKVQKWVKNAKGDYEPEAAK